MTVWRVLAVAIPVCGFCYAIGFVHGFMFLATSSSKPDQPVPNGGEEC